MIINPNLNNLTLHLQPPRKQCSPDISTHPLLPPNPHAFSNVNTNINRPRHRPTPCTTPSPFVPL